MHICRPVGFVTGGAAGEGRWGRWSFLRGHISAIGGLSMVVDNTMNGYFAAD